MSLLLDTHVLWWWLADDDSLTTEVKDVIDTGASVYFSAPFDRMLVAQARCEGLTLTTRDPQVRRDDVQWQPV